MVEHHFTSDLHFYHDKVCQFNDRPWESTENTERLIDLWNSTVRPGDTTYHMGDFSFLRHTDVQRLIDLIEALNGQKVFVLGNHDEDFLWSKVRRAGLSRVQFIGDTYRAKINGQLIYMCHFPWEVWNRSHYGTWHLHGHCHGNLEARGKRLDVGLDNHPEHRFFSFEEVKTHMDAQEIWAPDHHKPRSANNEVAGCPQETV